MMKNIIISLAAVLLFSLIGYAVAEEIDITGLNDGELIALQKKVDSTIFERNLYDGGIVFAGQYYVGKEIEEGQYLLTCVDVDKDSFWKQCIVYQEIPNPEYVEGKSSRKDQFIDVQEIHMDLGEQYQITMEEGQMMWITNGSVVVHKK